MRYKDALNFARQMRKNQTPAEKFFWTMVRNRGFLNMKFTRQYIIEFQEIMGVKSFYIVDFYCNEKRLIIEIDGKIHLFQKEKDAGRQKVLENMEYRVVRFKNEEVLYNWAKVREELKAILSGQL